MLFCWKKSPPLVSCFTVTKGEDLCELIAFVGVLGEFAASFEEVEMELCKRMAFCRVASSISSSEHSDERCLPESEFEEGVEYAVEVPVELPVEVGVDE